MGFTVMLQVLLESIVLQVLQIYSVQVGHLRISYVTGCIVLFSNYELS